MHLALHWAHDALQSLVDSVKKHHLVRHKTVWFMFTANAYFTLTIKREVCCVMLSIFHLFISGLKLSHRKWLAKLELPEYFQGTKQTLKKIKNCVHKDNVEKNGKYSGDCKNEGEEKDSQSLKT